MSRHKILAYQAYVPRGELQAQEISAALGSRGGSGSRAIAGFDEDSITMAVAAGLGISAVIEPGAPMYFATSNPPFLDKCNATVVASALGVGAWRSTIDLAGLRSGAAALMTAVATGGLVTMGDSRSGRPSSTEEADGGAGGAAFLFGEGDDAIAEIIGSSSVAIELMDTWRIPGQTHAAVWEERFSQHVLGRAITDVVAQVSKDSDVTDTPDHTVVSTPNARFAGSSTRTIGSASPGRDVLGAHRHTIGYCGAADIGLLLAQALDVAKAGETILLVTASGSVDALMVRALQDGPGHAVWSDRLANRRPVSYLTYLTWQGLLQREPTRRPERNAVSAPPAFRNARWKYALIGGRCVDCGKVYLPGHQVCACGCSQPQEDYPLAQRRGTIVAWSTDSVTDSPAPPALAALIDFDGGGRLSMEVADSAAEDVALGEQIEPVFRRTYQWRGVPNYFWKARPAKGSTS